MWSIHIRWNTLKKHWIQKYFFLIWRINEHYLKKLIVKNMLETLISSHSKLIIVRKINYYYYYLFKRKFKVENISLTSLLFCLLKFIAFFELISNMFFSIRCEPILFFIDVTTVILIHLNWGYFYNIIDWIFLITFQSISTEKYFLIKKILIQNKKKSNKLLIKNKLQKMLIIANIKIKKINYCQHQDKKLIISNIKINTTNVNKKNYSLHI